jgi:hypothetical protein
MTRDCAQNVVKIIVVSKAFVDENSSKFSTFRTVVHKTLTPVLASVVDPDPNPKESEGFGRIRIR